MAERREAEVTTLKAVASRLEGALLEVDRQICMFADGAPALCLRAAPSLFLRGGRVLHCGGAVCRLRAELVAGHVCSREPSAVRAGTRC